tara:strand:+ start:115 stop:495 length:381 start_codon:yes stop_codon:yes gene_type:complete
MLLGIQIVGVVFGIGMLYFSFLHFKRKEFGQKEAFIWMALWAGLIFVTILPNSLDFLVKKVLHLQRPLDFFIICGFLIITLLTFLNYVTAKRNSTKIKRMVRNIAIKETDREERKKQERETTRVEN